MTTKPGWRIEHDSMGEVRVPANHLWGAQTERSLHHFPIGQPRFRWPREVIAALGLVKSAAARANAELGTLDPAIAARIIAAADAIAAGTHDDEFPLVAFQTGSGTQTNMNANEVIAHLANRASPDAPPDSPRVHPNDHANRGQSSNDAFPTVMHVATHTTITTQTLPALARLRATLAAKSTDFATITMLGRTHLQDATPITLGQVISGWVAQLDAATTAIEATLPGLRQLALGGTAVGTGLATHPHFATTVARHIASATNTNFETAPNKFAALSAHDAILTASAALRGLAMAAMKIANDVRWYASGPRGGIGEITIPENEPGSSIMPGKINPTQCEALTMVAAQVFGNDATVAFANSQGNFQLNVFKPVILFNTIESATLLANSLDSFNNFCATGIEPNLPAITTHLTASLMLATALAPHIGYEKTAQIALSAHHTGTTLRDAALASGHVTEEQFDAWVRPEEMV